VRIVLRLATASASNNLLCLFRKVSHKKFYQQPVELVLYGDELLCTISASWWSHRAAIKHNMAVEFSQAFAWQLK
jgi:hypothetical protein